MSSNLQPHQLPPTHQGASSVSAQVSVQQRKRQIVPAACENCRKQKSKCDAKRPKCGGCLHRGTDCHYTTVTATETRTQALKRKYEELQVEKSPYEELFDLLKSMSQDESLEILRRIKAGGDVTAILRQVKAGDLLLQIALVPETRLSYDFPYLSEMPASILVLDNPYLACSIYGATFKGRPSPRAIVHSETSVTEYASPSLIPYHAAELIDPLIPRATTAAWTSVISDNNLLGGLLRAYFVYQYPYFAPFHKGYFLEDMVNGRHQFCSELLVNAVLAAACHTFDWVPNRYKFWDPQTLHYKFMAEARRLWEIEIGQSSLTTIQASLIMNLTANMNGLDKVGSLYLLQAVSMAQDLDLFKAPTQVRSVKMRKARIATAWGLFIWQAQTCYYFFQPPFFRDPPEPALPGPEADQDWYGEIWIRYPQGQKLSPTHLGHTIRAIATFRIIMNDLGSQLFGNPETQGQLTLKEVYHFKARLDAWFKNLPDALTPEKIVFPAQLKIHMEYYTTLIAIFQSQVASTAELVEFGGIDMVFTPSKIIHDAQVRVETLIRLYYLRHGYDSYDSMLLYFLIFLGNFTLECLGANAEVNNAPESREALRSTLILCVKGIHSQRSNYTLADLVYRTVIPRMKPEDVDLLQRYTSPKDVNGQELSRAQHARAAWPLPVIKLTEDPTKARLGNLITRYEQLAVSTDSRSSPGGELDS